MTSKEKAKQLIDKHYSISGNQRFAIMYSLITVDEILNAIEPAQFRVWHHESMTTEFWIEVKKEITYYKFV